MIGNIKEIISPILNYTLPVVIISTVIIVSLRITDLIIKKEKIVLYKELLKLFFILYILCLFQVVTYQDVGSANANFIPFREMFRYSFGSYSFSKNILGNLLLFFPFGLFLGYLFKIKKTYIIAILSFVASCSIEITQLSIGRIFDVDDIILNVCGAVLGFLLYKLFHRFSDIIPNKLKKEWIINLFTIIVIIIAVRLLFI